MSGWVFQVFVFRDGQFLGTEMATGDSFMLGRDASCAVVVQDDAASRQHARIHVQDGQFVLTDLGSANGTFVNSQRVSSPVLVSARDELRIGRHTFKLKVISAGADAPGPAAMAAPAMTAVLDGQHPGASSLGAGAGMPMTVPAAAGVAPAPAPRASHVEQEPTEIEMSLPQWRPGGGGPPPSDLTVEARVPAELLRELQKGQQQRANHRPAPSAPHMPAVVAQAPYAPPPAVVQPPPAPYIPPPAPAMPPPAAVMPPPAAPRPTAPPAAMPMPAPVAEAPAWVPHDPAEDEDDDEDEEEHDHVPHLDFSLLDHLRDEQRLRGVRQVAEVMAVDGDHLGSYQAVPQGKSHRVVIPAVNGRKKQSHLLVKHGKTGVELRLASGMQGTLFRGGRAMPIEGTNSTLSVGESAQVLWNNHAWMVRVAPAPERLSELTSAPAVDPALQKLDRKILGISSGGSLGAHLLLFLVFFIVGLLSPRAKVTQLEDEFAEIALPEVKLEEPPPEPEPPAPEPEPEPPPPEPQPQPKVKVRPTARRQRTAAPEAAAPKPGLLAALTKLPQGKKGGSQTVLAAVSNINAVKVPGGQSGFKVSALIGKGPSNRVQIGGAGGGVSPKGLNSVLREGGAGVLGGKGKGNVRGRPAMALHRQAKAVGQLTREEISKVINKHMGEIQFCYERELLKQPSLQGKVVFEWTIKQDGRVLVVKTKVGGLPSAGATNCMIDKIKRWVFPKPRGGGVVLVTYPFIFKQSGF